MLRKVYLVIRTRISGSSDPKTSYCFFPAKTTGGGRLCTDYWLKVMSLYFSQMIIITKAQTQSGPKKGSRTPYSCKELGSTKYWKKKIEKETNMFTELIKTSCGLGYGSEVDDGSRNTVLFLKDILKNRQWTALISSELKQLYQPLMMRYWKRKNGFQQSEDLRCLSDSERAEPQGVKHEPWDVSLVQFWEVRFEKPARTCKEEICFFL